MRTLHFASGLAATALACLMVAGCGSRSESEAIAGAKALLAKRESAKAVVELKNVLDANQNSAEARYLLGTALLDQGEPNAAIVEFNKAKELGYNDVELIPKIARSMAIAGRAKEALAAYKDTQLPDPKAQAELRTAIAVSLARSGEPAQAAAIVEEALKLQPTDFWALLTKTRLLASMGDVDGALKVIDLAQASAGTSGEAQYLRGFILQHGRQDADGAVKAYRDAQQDSKFLRPSLQALFGLYLGQRKLDQVKSVQAEMAKASPNGTPTMLAEAQIAYIEGDLARSRELLDKVVRRWPSDPRVIIFSAGVDVRRRAYLSAEAQLGKLIKQNDTFPVARKLMAEAYSRMGQPDKALAVLQPLVDSGTEDAELMALVGEAHLQRGDFARAEPLFAAALKIKPNDIRLRTVAALADLNKGNTAPALDALQDIAAADAGDVADKALISAHVRRGDSNAALAAIDQLEKKPSGKVTAHFLRGLVRRSLGEPAKARPEFESALKLEPTLVAASVNLAELDWMEGRGTDARQRLDAAIAANPNSVPLRMALLTLLLRQRAGTDVIGAAIEEAVKADPADTQPRLFAINRLLREGNASGAASSSRAALAAIPDSPELLDAAGRALAASGSDEEAISTFGKLVTLRPRSAMPHLRMADVFAKRKDWTSASSALRRATDIEPESIELHRRLLLLAAQTKDAARVLSVARDLQKKRPTSAAGFLLEGDAEAGRKNWPAAVAAFRQALDKADPASRPQIRLFDVQIAAGHTDAAAKFAADWTQSHPKDGRFLEHLGEVAIGRKEYTRAERYLRSAVELDSRSVPALNNLAWVLAQRGDKSALGHAQKAAALAPDSPAVFDTLAAAYAAQGDMARAIDTQKRAIAFAAEPGHFQLTLAKLYAKAGERSKALAELDALAALGDRFPAQAGVAALRKELSSKAP